MSEIRVEGRSQRRAGLNPELPGSQGKRGNSGSATPKSAYVALGQEACGQERDSFPSTGLRVRSPLGLRPQRSGSCSSEAEGLCGVSGSLPCHPGICANTDGTGHTHHLCTPRSRGLEGRWLGPGHCEVSSAESQPDPLSRAGLPVRPAPHGLVKSWLGPGARSPRAGRP